jgi:hypothetical protein
MCRLRCCFAQSLRAELFIELLGANGNACLTRSSFRVAAELLFSTLLFFGFFLTLRAVLFNVANFIAVKTLADF